MKIFENIFIEGPKILEFELDCAQNFYYIGRMKSNRESLLSYFTWLVGGFNSSPPTSSKIGLYVENSENDEEVARYILKCHKESIERPLKQEIVELKAKLYDLENK